METSGHRPLATTTVALVILMGIHVVRSSFAMVVWNIGEGQSPAALLLIASGIWVAGLAGWAIVPWVDSPRLGLRLALLFAVLYAAGHAVRHPVLTPALVSASLVAWLWMMPALIRPREAIFSDWTSCDSASVSFWMASASSLFCTSSF